MPHEPQILPAGQPTLPGGNWKLYVQLLFYMYYEKKRKKTTFLCPGAWNEISLRVCWDVCVFLVDNVSKLMKRNGRQQHCDPYSGVSLQSASRRARFGTNGWTDRRPSPSSPKWNCPSSRSWDTVNGPTFTVWLPVKHKSFSLFILVFHSRKKTWKEFLVENECERRIQSAHDWRQMR